MKRFVAFAAVLFVALAGLYYSQRREKEAHVSANAVLRLAADAQRDLSRAPMEMTRISDEEEIAIGNEIASRFLVSTPNQTAESKASEKYIQRIGASLAARAHRKLPYRFHLIPDSNLINAFALPGGHVFMGKGMFDLLDTDDELANVLAHEIEHIDHYHCVERYQVEAKLRHLQLGAAVDLVQLPLGLWQAGYQKDQELEADEEGMRLAALAGFSPYGAVSLFEKLEKLHREYVLHAENPVEEMSAIALESLLGYFRSHPEPSERLAVAKSLIAQNHWEDRESQNPIHLEYKVHNGKLGE
jgi:predicted Zn-dependent protease